jgi:hypothetical protein
MTDDYRLLTNDNWNPPIARDTFARRRLGDAKFWVRGPKGTYALSLERISKPSIGLLERISRPLVTRRVSEGCLWNCFVCSPSLTLRVSACRARAVLKCALVIHTEPYSLWESRAFRPEERQCGLRNRAILNAKKPHPAAPASDLHREVMLVTRTPKVILAPDFGFEMRSSYLTIVICH